VSAYGCRRHMARCWVTQHGGCLSIPDSLETKSITPALLRGKWWELLKRSIRLRATRRSLALVKERRDLRRQIERGSHEAKLHYEDRPTDAAAVAAWVDSHQLLQALHSSAA
jgi:hypothetical protein